MRKEQINTEITNLQEALKPLYLKQQELEKEIGSQVATFLLDKWKTNNLEATTLPIMKVDLDSNYTTIRIKSVVSEQFGEINIRHAETRLTSKSDYEIGWYASNANATNLKHLYYLEILGIVAKQIRTPKSELIDIIEKGVGRIYSVKKLVSNAEIEISSLVQEKQGIETHELYEEVLVKREVIYDEPIYMFIRESDRGRFKNGRRAVKRIAITKETDKTIEISFYGENGIGFDTLRKPKDEAIRWLANELQSQKKEKKVVVD